MPKQMATKRLQFFFLDASAAAVLLLLGIAPGFWTFMLTLALIGMQVWARARGVPTEMFIRAGRGFLLGRSRYIRPPDRDSGRVL